MSKRTITATVGAYLTSCSAAGVLADSDAANIVSDLGYTNLDMSSSWTRVGKATITVEFEETEKITAKAVEQMREQQNELRAKAEAACTELERCIQSLLAIAHDANVVEA